MSDPLTSVDEAASGSPDPDAASAEPSDSEDATVGEPADADDVAAADGVPADGGPGAEPPTGEASPDDELAAALVERDQFRDLAARSQAELDNFRKQSIKRQTEAIERANEGLVERLLPVLDAFDGARAHHPDDESLIALGTALWTVLEREGLERIGEVGDGFDPNVHEAVRHTEGDGTHDTPTVADVMRAGYRYKGRVLRAAMVTVAGS